MAQKPYQTVVLNTIAALAANVDLTGGKISFLNASGALLADKIRLTDGTAYSKTAYAAGTASVKTVTLTGITLAANTIYRMTVRIDGRIDFASGGGKESNALFVTREYDVSSGTAVPTANEIEDLFTARINGDAAAGVTASSGGAGVLTLTLDSVVYGDFFVDSYPTGAVVATTTPYVAPSGTPAIVDEFVTPGTTSATANYTTWKISFNRPFRSGAISGSIVAQPEFVYIFADDNAANYAAFATEVDAILAGTHTPVADYLGI